MENVQIRIVNEESLPKKTFPLFEHCDMYLTTYLVSTYKWRRVFEVAHRQAGKWGKINF